MTESIILLVGGILILLIILFIRHGIASRKMSPPSKRVEAIIRYALCLLTAIIAVVSSHSISGNLGAAFLLAIAVDSLIVYAVTHLFDRLIIGE